MPTCADLGIAVVAYSPLAHNLLTGTVTELPPGDMRASLPRCGPPTPRRARQIVAMRQTPQKWVATPGTLVFWSGFLFCIHGAAEYFILKPTR